MLCYKTDACTHSAITALSMQPLCLSTAVAPKSKGAFHARDESFSSSIQSNDSVFTDTDFLSSLQTSGSGFVLNESLGGGKSPEMGSNQGKLSADEAPTRLNRAAIVESGQGVLSKKKEDKRSPKDSGYGSRSNTDDLQSPSHMSSSDKSSPGSLPSTTRGEGSTPGNTASEPDEGEMKIFTLATSPVLVNKSYLQFYYVDDSSIVTEALSHDLIKTTPNRMSTPTRRKYPKEPMLPRKEKLKATQNQLTVKPIKAMKSASCSSLDRLSLTSSLEEYASKGAMMSGEEVGDDNEQFGRGRLLSVTRFEILTGNLETPQSATIVKVAGPSPSSATSSQKEKKQRKHLLSRFHIGRWKTKSGSVEPGDRSKGVIMTQAGQVRLRKKQRQHGRRRRMVVSDDLTHKVKFAIGEAESVTLQADSDAVDRKCQLRTATAKPSTPTHTNTTEARTGKKNTRTVLVKQTDRSRKEELSRSAEHTPPTAGMYLVHENHIGPFSAELSQSLDGGLSDLKHLEIQLKKLAQPSQSTTDLDLSQRVLEIETSVGLRVSHSMDDISDHMGACSLSQAKDTSSIEPFREGFLWRVLGRASQRWPALIHIVPIQNNQSGMRGFGVRKGQQVRALYRVSGQVIVETETNHLACIPYECCRISRKYYGPDSQLVQHCYTQLYVPVPDLPASIGKTSSTSDNASHSPARHLLIHTPIEMVAIQDNYDRLPLGEMNVDAGDKLRVLYCDEKRVYAVKENGEAGLIARNFCRLTRKSEKMYQKWVELTRSPFQADYPVKFGEKPPRYLFDGTLSVLKEVRSKPTTPEAHRKLRVTSTQGDTKGYSSVSKRGASKHKQLPPTPPGKRKEKTPVSPLTQNGLRSPMSPVRQLSGLHQQRTLSPTTAESPVRSLPPSPLPPSLPPSPLPPSPLPPSPPPQSPLKRSVAAKCSSTPSNLRGAETHPPAPGRQRQPFSYSGKLMTVVKNYRPDLRNAESTIRKGLRVRVVRSSPDGKSFRVATKTGTQFDIPVSHLCISRKNSEPSPFRNEREITLVSSTSTPSEHHHNTLPERTSKRKLLMSPKLSNRLPLECGKIMTVIRNFVPSPDDPMITIRRGLRVKVLGGQEDQVKVVTKTGTTFSIPRSYLRLAHKNSDASVFAAVDASTKSPPTSPHTLVHSPEATEPDGTFKMETSNTPSPSVKKHSCISPSVNGSHLPSSSCNGSPSRNQHSSNGAEGAMPADANPARRGCRVNSTGGQVFELC